MARKAASPEPPVPCISLFQETGMEVHPTIRDVLERRERLLKQRDHLHQHVAETQQLVHALTARDVQALASNGAFGMQSPALTDAKSQCHRLHEQLQTTEEALALLEAERKAAYNAVCEEVMRAFEHLAIAPLEQRLAAIEAEVAAVTELQKLYREAVRLCGPLPSEKLKRLCWFAPPVLDVDAARTTLARLTAPPTAEES